MKNNLSAKSMLQLTTNELSSIIRTYNSYLENSKQDNPEEYGLKMFNKGFEYGLGILLTRLESLENFVKTSKVELTNEKELV